jgi:hypothetical protein
MTVKSGGGSGGPPPRFDISDDGGEETQPDVLAARERRRIALHTLGGMVGDTNLDLIRAAQAELGLRLGTLEQRMGTLVQQMIDVMVSDQAHDESLVRVEKDFADVKEQLAQLLTWIKGNAGP